MYQQLSLFEVQQPMPVKQKAQAIKHRVVVRTSDRGYLAFEYDKTDAELKSDRHHRELLSDIRYLVYIDGVAQKHKRAKGAEHSCNAHARENAALRLNPLGLAQLDDMVKFCQETAKKRPKDSPLVILDYVLETYSVAHVKRDAAGNQLLDAWLKADQKAADKQRGLKAKSEAKTSRPAKSGTKRCPSCGRSGDIDTDFGYRQIGCKTVPQSWCRSCR